MPGAATGPAAGAGAPAGAGVAPAAAGSSAGRCAAAAAAASWAAVHLRVPRRMQSRWAESFPSPCCCRPHCRTGPTAWREASTACCVHMPGAGRAAGARGRSLGLRRVGQHGGVRGRVGLGGDRGACGRRRVHSLLHERARHVCGRAGSPALITSPKGVVTRACTHGSARQRHTKAACSCTCMSAGRLSIRASLCDRLPQQDAGRAVSSGAAPPPERCLHLARPRVGLREARPAEPEAVRRRAPCDRHPVSRRVEGHLEPWPHPATLASATRVSHLGSWPHPATLARATHRQGSQCSSRCVTLSGCTRSRPQRRLGTCCGAVQAQATAHLALTRCPP